MDAVMEFLKDIPVGAYVIFGVAGGFATVMLILSWLTTQDSTHGINEPPARPAPAAEGVIDVDILDVAQPCAGCDHVMEAGTLASRCKRCGAHYHQGCHEGIGWACVARACGAHAVPADAAPAAGAPAEPAQVVEAPVEPAAEPSPEPAAAPVEPAAAAEPPAKEA